MVQHVHRLLLRARMTSHAQARLGVSVLFPLLKLAPRDLKAQPEA